MKTEMMEDYSVTCILGRPLRAGHLPDCSVWALLLSPLSPLKGRRVKYSSLAVEVRVDSLLTQEHPSLELCIQAQRWAWVHPFRTRFHHSKKKKKGKNNNNQKHALQLGKSCIDFLYNWVERKGSSEANAEWKLNSRALNYTLKKDLY